MRTSSMVSAVAVFACGLLMVSGCSPARDWRAELAQADQERDGQMAELEAWRERETAACQATVDADACKTRIWNQYFERTNSIWSAHLAKTNRIFAGEPVEAPASKGFELR